MLSKVTLAACVAVIFSVFSPDRLILFPSRDEQPADGAARRTLSFQGGELEIWVARSAPPSFQRGEKPLHSTQAPRLQKTPDLYVLRFYGNADRAEPNVAAEAREWAAGDAEFWGVNYPGYGGSTGPAKLAKIGPTALAAFDALQREAAGKPILVYGTSLGTTAALHVAAHRPVAGVILQNPPPIKQIILRQFGWWNLWLIAGPVAWAIPAELDSIANARATQALGIFVLAEKDDVVSPKFQQLIVAAYAGPKRIVTQAGARHNEPLDSGTAELFHAAVAGLLKQAASR